jgi:hypothetical protein
MDTLVRAEADELNSSLSDFIKSHFKGKKIAVHIYEVEIDETEYLLSDPQHKRELLESIAKVRQTKNLKAYTLEEIQSLLNEPEP